jgi:hypothetical protein
VLPGWANRIYQALQVAVDILLMTLPIVILRIEMIERCVASVPRVPERILATRSPTPASD